MVDRNKEAKAIDQRKKKDKQHKKLIPNHTQFHLPPYFSRYTLVHRH